MPAAAPHWQLFTARDFPAHAAAWRSLNVATADCPVLDPDFVAPLLEHFPNPRARLAIAGTPHDPVAMTIVAPTRFGVWQTLQPSQAPVCLWLARPEVSADALSAGLLRKLPGMPLLLGLSQIDPDILAPPPGDARLQTLDYIRTGRVTVSGSFDEYWAERGKNLRHNLKRQLNRMAAEGLTGQLDVLTKPEDIPSAIVEYGRLETAGWKADSGTAIAPDNAQGRFYRAMLERFAERGAARVYRYQLGEKVAALDLCIEQGGALIILKTTYDEAIAGYSPAMLMRQAAFKRIFDEGQFRRIEFYGKVMDWHTKWTKEIRTMYHLNYFRLPFVSQLYRSRTAIRDALSAAS